MSTLITNIGELVTNVPEAGGVTAAAVGGIGAAADGAEPQTAGTGAVSPR